MISLPTFRGVLSGFNPLSLSPALWLKDTGSDPSVWTDMSGNGRDATGSNQPGIITNALNGKQVRRFDGVNDSLSVTTGLGMLRNVPGVTIIAAYKWISNPTAGSILFFASTGSVSNASRAVLGAGVTSRKLICGGRRLDADSFQGVTSAADNPTTFFVHSAVLNYANSDAFQYANNVLDGTSTSFQTDGNTQNTDSISITIGSQAESFSFANVDLAEILVFPTALSTVNRQKVERYLSGKYAIAF